MRVDNHNLLREAADNIHSALRRWQLEPTDDNKLSLATVCRHYTTAGLEVRLKPGPVVVIKEKETVCINGKS